jgi:hypothetical protein
MARFLSEDWIAAFNAALSSLDAGGASSGSLRASSGRFSVEEAVSGVPGRPEDAGPLRIVLCVDEGTVSLAAKEPEAPPSDVEIALGYHDAAALSRGELDPTEALGAGRVRVRGDLAVLVAGQEVLAAAAAQTSALQAETTY